MERRRNKKSRHDFTEVFSWGNDEYGQLGLAGAKGNYPTHAIPRFCSYNILIDSVSCGARHAAFLTHNSLLYTVGSNLQG